VVYETLTSKGLGLGLEDIVLKHIPVIYVFAKAIKTQLALFYVLSHRFKTTNTSLSKFYQQF